MDAASSVLDRPNEIYEADPAAWSREQARLLRERRFTEVDRENAIEEVEDLARNVAGEDRDRGHLLGRNPSLARDETFYKTVAAARGKAVHLPVTELKAAERLVRSTISARWNSIRSMLSGCSVFSA